MKPTKKKRHLAGTLFHIVEVHKECTKPCAINETCTGSGPVGTEITMQGKELTGLAVGNLEEDGSSHDGRPGYVVKKTLV